MLMSVNLDVEVAASVVRINTEDSLVLVQWDHSVPEMDTVSVDNLASNSKCLTLDTEVSVCHHRHHNLDTANHHKLTPSASNVCPAAIPNDDPADRLTEARRAAASSKLAINRNWPTSTPHSRSRST